MEHNERLAPEPAIHSIVAVPAFQFAVAKHADSDVLWTTAGTPDTVCVDEDAENCKHSSLDDLWSCGRIRFDTAANIVSANLKGINGNRSVSQRQMTY